MKRIRTGIRSLGAGIILVWLLTAFFSAGTVWAAADTSESGETAETADTSEDAEMAETADTSKAADISDTADELLASMDLTEVQTMLDELLGSGSFSIKEALLKMTRGEEAFSDESVREFLRCFFLSGISAEKELFTRLIALLVLSAVFAGFADAFHNSQIGEISFYMVYLLVFILLMDSFSEMSGSLQKTVGWLTEFLRALAPAYFLAVSAASGTAEAAVFYEGVLILVWLIQWLLLTLILPGTNLYILLSLISHLSREEMLGKMTELLHTALLWGMKTLLGAAAGLQIVRNLVAPVMDSLKRGLIGRAAGALPGVGNAVNMVTELVVTSAVLVRNCLGVVLLTALVLAGAGPVIHYGILSLEYRFLAAAAQPVSDKRMVRCLSTMGEGCALLMRILFTAEVLCMLAFLVLMAGT